MSIWLRASVEAWGPVTPHPVEGFCVQCGMAECETRQAVVINALADVINAFKDAPDDDTERRQVFAAAVSLQDAPGASAADRRKMLRNLCSNWAVPRKEKTADGKWKDRDLPNITADLTFAVLDAARRCLAASPEAEHEVNIKHLIRKDDEATQRRVQWLRLGAAAP